MLKTNTTRSTITRYLLITPVLLMLIAVFSCENSMATLQEEPSSTVVGEVFSEVEVFPAPQGSMTEFYTYIQENLKYPEEAKKNGIEGKVFVEFVVDKSGKVHDVVVLRGVGSGCDAEAMRVIANGPNWTPGVNEGQAVNVKMVLPLTFKLN